MSQPGTDGGYTIGTAPVGYFDDALFIGDSRTVGLAEYGRIRGATFFATTGMSVYNIDDEQVPMAGGKKTDFRTLLQENTYGKIYVMLGINELGYDRDETIAAYEQLLLRIRREQPNAVIILQANLHVTAQRSEEDDVFNNEGINDFNSRVRELADNKTIFYLDVNELFDDEDGNLNADYTFDQTHILGKYYGRWAGWLDKNAVIPS